MTLHNRQSETQVTDSHAAGSGLLKCSKEWVIVEWGVQPALEWLPFWPIACPLARLMLRKCLHLSASVCQL